MKALAFLSLPRQAHPRFPDSNVADPLTPEQLANNRTLNAEEEDQSRKLSHMVEEWEKARASTVQTFSEAVSAQELDRLIAFYVSPLGQSLVATKPHGEKDIRTIVAQFIARQ
jgi:hypothetical protein